MVVVSVVYLIIQFVIYFMYKDSKESGKGPSTGVIVIVIIFGGIFGIIALVLIGFGIFHLFLQLT